MRPRHPLPGVWLMTDERIGAALWSALQRLPPGSGVVFRHYHTPPAERRRIFAKVRRIARARGLLLVVAGTPAGGGAHGQHGPGKRRPGIRTWPVHTPDEARRARILRADAVFVSPVFATRSHPDASTLALPGAARLARIAQRPAIALGGMTTARFRELDHRLFWGWAAIDAWVTDQKRKAVPM